MKANPLAAMVLVGAVLTLGCQQARVQPVRAARLEGASSFQFVERPLVATAGSAEQPLVMASEPVDVKVKAEPIEPLAKPIYPRVALGRLRLPMIVGVRLTVDAAGQVSHVGGSLVAFSSGGEQAEVFREAVETAIAQWRFRPAEFRHMVPRRGAPGQASYWQVMRVQPTDDTFDVAFTFSTKGDVLTEGLR